MTIRQFILVSHRWLGLTAGAVLCVAGATGALLVLPPGPGWGLVGLLHETLALGRFGSWLVIGATAGAVLLEGGGAVLWWRRRVIGINIHLGWRRALADLHHVAGILGLAGMMVIAATGVVLPFVTPDDQPTLRQLAMDLHTARAYDWPVKVFYLLCALTFAVQGVTGLVMWWRPAVSSRTIRP